MKSINKYYQLALILMFFVSSTAKSQETYDQAKEYWNTIRDREDYMEYLKEFAQYNNHFKLDERNGCYSLDNTFVEFVLVVNHKPGQEYAVIESTLSNVDSPKMSCFHRSYVGIPMKIPPFLPFVIPMQMGGENGNLPVTPHGR